MTIQNSSNFTAGNLFSWADASTDTFARTHVAGPAQQLDLHDHSSGKGLAVARVGANVLSTASGGIFDVTLPANVGTAATGSAAIAARRDHVHATGAGTPVAQASGDIAATGTGPAAAMTDHKHSLRLSLGRMTTPATMGSSAAEQTAATITIPAGTLGTNGGLRVTVSAHYLATAGGASDLTVKVKYGTVVAGLFFMAAVANAADARAFAMQTIISAKASSADQASYSTSRLDAATAASVGAPPTATSVTLQSSGQVVNTALGVNSAISQDVIVTVQHSVSAATINLIVDSVFVEFL